MPGVNVPCGCAGVLAVVLLAVLWVQLSWWSVDRQDVAARESPQGHVVVVGGGLAGLLAAYSALQDGGVAHVTLVEKMPRIGGNSMKASSGLSAAPTEVQRQHGVEDSIVAFLEDTTAAAMGLPEEPDKRP
eukprot:RCo049185